MTHPAVGFVQHFTWRIFQPVGVALGDIAHHSKVFAFGRPVGILNGVQNWPRRAAAKRQPRERAHLNISWPNAMKVLDHEKLAGTRDRRDRIRLYSHGTQTLAIESSGVKRESGI